VLTVYGNVVVFVCVISDVERNDLVWDAVPIKVGFDVDIGAAGLSPFFAAVNLQDSHPITARILLFHRRFGLVPFAWLI
jgi:hypothetical protein